MDTSDNSEGHNGQNDEIVPEMPVPEAFLEAMFGGDAGKIQRVGRERVVVGRGSEADFVLDDVTMSRRHAAIEWGQNGFHIADLESGNGVRINGELVSEFDLEDGATIELGSTVLVLKFGRNPQSAPAGAGLRDQDTQELPALANVSAISGRVGPGSSGPMASTGARPLMRTQSSGRTAPSPRIAQLVSWLVVLALVVGGILLILNVLQSAKGSLLKQPAEEQAAVGKRHQKTLVLRTSTVPPSREDGAFDNTQVLNAPDVALEMFQQAELLEKEEKYRETREMLYEISSRYPEFSPPSGLSVLEKMDKLNKMILYSEIVEQASTVLELKEPEREQLQQAILALSAIPSTNGQFGEKAMLLADQGKTKLKQLDLTIGEEKGLEDGSTDALAGEEPGLEDAGGEAEETNELLEETRKKARSSYKEGDFKEAARKFFRAAKKAEDTKAAESLKKFGGRIEDFDRQYSEARSLAGKKGSEDKAIKALKKARSLDGRLFGSYRKQINGDLVDVYAELATRYMDGGDCRRARENLNLARKIDSSARTVSKMENLFSFRAAILLRKARDAENNEAAMKALGKAICLAGKGSGVEMEARRMKEKLLAEAVKDEDKKEEEKEEQQLPDSQ